MRIMIAVVVPVLFQALFLAGIVAATNGTGSFVGLGALLIGVLAIPVTAVHNWGVSKRSRGNVTEAAFWIVLVSLVYPACILVLYAVAS